jgi:hypothetical protein
MMLRLWRWTFARAYIRHLRRLGKADLPAFTASGVLTIVIFFNLLVPFVIVLRVLEVRPRFSAHLPEVAAFTLLLLLVVYRHFVTNRSADALIKKLQTQTRERTRREERVLSLWIFTSVALPLLLARLLAWP